MTQRGVLTAEVSSFYNHWLLPEFEIDVIFQDILSLRPCGMNSM